MKLNQILFSALVLCFWSIAPAQSIVVINEFMSDNESTLADRDGYFADWIELYNPGNQEINLANYSLSDKADNPKKWVFPAVNIPAKGFLLVFASKKNSNLGGELHTNFKIDSDGEALFLSNASGDLIDQTEARSLSADESFGRVPDGGKNWVVMSQTTPGESNFIADVILVSHQPGFYNKAFYQELTALSGDTIYYTLNGDNPTPFSAVYEAPILIGSRTHLPNTFSMIPSSPHWEAPIGQVDKMMTLRYATYKDRRRTSKMHTLTFLVDPNAHKLYSMPVISLVTDSLNFFHAYSGIYVKGKDSDTADFWTANYFLKGMTTERPIHIEYFNEKGQLEFSQDAGVRIHGGYTRGLPQKSFRLYARSRYGESKFDYPLLPNREVDKYDQFVLRTALGSWYNSTIMQDQLCQELCRDLNLDGQDVRPVLVFLNGEYWGIYTLRDRIDENYLNYMHGVNKDSVEIKENWEKEGEPLFEFLENHDLSIDENYELMKAKIDVDNYIDYQIAQQFFVNYDWPGQNVKMWRSTATGGKWRWIYFDLDGTFGSPEYPMIRHCTMNDTSIDHPNPPHSTFLFRNMIKNQSFVDQFLSRYQEVIKNDFEPTHMSYTLNTMRNEFAPEIYRQSLRWHKPKHWSTWEQDVDSILLDFLNRRACYVEQHIQNHFGISDFDANCSEEQESDEDQISVAPNPSDGEITLHNSGKTITNARFVLYDNALREVYQSDVFEFDQYALYTIDLRGIPSQTYIVRVIGDNFVEHHKLIVVR